jgi:hypothetical protein
VAANLSSAQSSLVTYITGLVFRLAATGLIGPKNPSLIYLGMGALAMANVPGADHLKEGLYTGANAKKVSARKAPDTFLPDFD